MLTVMSCHVEMPSRTSQEAMSCVIAVCIPIHMQAATPQLSGLAQRYPPIRCIIQYGQLLLAAAVRSDQANGPDPRLNLQAMGHSLNEDHWRGLQSMLAGGCAGYCGWGVRSCGSNSCHYM